MYVLVLFQFLLYNSLLYFITLQYLIKFNLLVLLTNGTNSGINKFFFFFLTMVEYYMN